MGRVKFLGVKAVGAIRLSGLPADGDTVTIGPVPAVGGVVGKRFEFDNNASVAAGNIAVTIGGSVAATITNLIAAINANKPTPVGVTAEPDPVATDTARLKGDQNGAAGNLALAKVGANVIVSGAAMTGGENAGNQTQHRGEHVVTAIDVSAGAIVIETGLQGPRFLQVDVIDATDKPKYITSITKFVGSAIVIDFDGATNPAAGDKVEWSAYE